MNVNPKLIIAAGLLSFFTSADNAPAQGQHDHGDVLPYLSGGNLVTDGYIDATAERVPNVRVFGLEFGEDPDLPFFINDPGFNALAGSLTPGHRIGFQLVGNLLFWDGSGSEPDFQPAPAGHSLRLNFGSASLDRIADGTSHNAAPRFFGPAAAGNGSVHEHLNSELLGVDENTTPGFYRLDLQVLTDDNGVVDAIGTRTSPTVYFIYNNGGDEELHHESMEFVRDNGAPGSNLVPEPASTSLAALAASFALLGRRRRARRPRRS